MNFIHTCDRGRVGTRAVGRGVGWGVQDNRVPRVVLVSVWRTFMYEIIISSNHMVIEVLLTPPIVFL